MEGFENVVGKGENAGYQHFLFFPTMLSKDFFRKIIKISCIVWQINTSYII